MISPWTLVKPEMANKLKMWHANEYHSTNSGCIKTEIKSTILQPYSGKKKIMPRIT